MIEIIKVSLIIIGTIIGAGFASGKEIQVFFVEFGKYGIIGEFVASFLIGLIIYKTFKIIEFKKINSYDEFLNVIIPNKKIINYLKIIINIFLLISFFAMITGFSSYLNQEYNIPSICGNLIFVVAIYFILNKDIKGISAINNALIPVLIIYFVYLGSLNMPYILEISEVNIYKTNWIWKAILYASYNVLTLIPLLVELKKLLHKKNLKVAIFTGVIFLILMLIIFGLIIRGGISVRSLELPLPECVKIFGNINGKLYGGIIIIAILTTAISSGYTFLKNISNYKKGLIVICFVGILLTKIKFSNFIEFLYPGFGIIGLFQIYYILSYKIVLKKKVKTDINIV